MTTPNHPHPVPPPVGSASADRSPVAGASRPRLHRHSEPPPLRHSERSEESQPPNHQQPSLARGTEPDSASPGGLRSNPTSPFQPTLSPHPPALGIAWRPELALYIDRRPDLSFVEILAENHDPARPLPQPLLDLLRRGTRIIPHGVSLSLGGADPLHQHRIDHLARLAERCHAPLVSEHIAFCRAGSVEIGHLTPVPRTRASLDLLIQNVTRLRRTLGVPLALENISALFDWPDAEMTESAFISELLDATDSLLLLDVANVYANAANLHADPDALFDHLPLHRLAYVHVGGGEERDGLYHDTHAHPVPPGVFDLLTRLLARTTPPGVMLERDGDFPAPPDIDRELASLSSAITAGLRLRQSPHA